MLELHNRVIRPQLLADFLAGYHFAGVLQQFSEDQERLLAQADLFGFVLAQFTGAKVEFKACETTSPLEVLTATGTPRCLKVYHLVQVLVCPYVLPTLHFCRG